MKIIELIGDVDGQHGRHARIPAGQVPVIVFPPGQDEAGRLWADGVASEWSAELPILWKTSTRWMTLTRRTRLEAR